MKLSTEPKQTLSYRELSCGCQGGGGEGEMDIAFGVGRCKLLHIEWINKMGLNSVSPEYLGGPGCLRFKLTWK